VDQNLKLWTNLNYIIKPQNDLFPQLPENEDVTMRMAKVFGLEAPSLDAI
jgi:serine/threonine-protein kinase HipA